MEKMNKVEIATEFIDRFCSGTLEGLEELLLDDFRFKGPLFHFSSREDYLESLHNDPPKHGDCKILSITENSEEVSIYYDYGKEEGCLTIAQLFKFKSNKISEILLVFDSKAFV